MIAHDKLVMGELQIKGGKNVSMAHGGSFMSNSFANGKTKDEIFDDFICELFTNKLDISTSVKKSFFRSDGHSSILHPETLPLD